MQLPVKPSQVPARLGAGAFILNSGLGKLKIDDEHAVMLHRMASPAYPFLGKLPSRTLPGCSPPVSWRSAQPSSSLSCLQAWPTPA